MSNERWCHFGARTHARAHEAIRFYEDALKFTPSSTKKTLDDILKKKRTSEDIFNFTPSEKEKNEKTKRDGGNGEGGSGGSDGVISRERDEGKKGKNGFPEKKRLQPGKSNKNVSLTTTMTTTTTTTTMATALKIPAASRPTAPRPARRSRSPRWGRSARPSSSDPAARRVHSKLGKMPFDCFRGTQDPQNATRRRHKWSKKD